MTYKLISKITPSSTQVNFTGIPSTYTDLLVMAVGRGSGGSTKDRLLCLPQVGSISDTYKYIGLGNENNNTSNGAENSAGLTSFISGSISGGGNSSGRVGVSMIYFPNYNSTSTGNNLSYSAVLRISSDSLVTNNSAFKGGGLGTNLTTLRFQLESGTNFTQTTFYLYGIV